MRNFRKAALAGATAVAVAFGSTAVATAQTEAPETTTEATAPAKPTREAKPGVDNDTAKTNGSSTKLGNKLGVWEKTKDGKVQLNGTDGRAIFGSTSNSENQPTYAKVGLGISVFAAVSAVIGLLVGPLYNFIVHGPVKF
ncbi:hypothetical protein HMPREF2785_06295 [Corynebacterium sp. HMSC067D03]|uniref:hypothetical protein n=1 Tax=Corynebacterium sp. HMSC067D03 TaxID=1739289 RepID=UPI0008A23C78|nr:hypothetical protein [Corynebacterium sp. HMSC067D03]OFL18025.1 hypothetical protein HMPREF2785_06295 [Corynebacterium sp. HMSC067D03]